MSLAPRRTYIPGVRFWRSLPGTVVVVFLLGGAVAVGAVSLQVHRITHPPRIPPSGLGVAADLVAIEEIHFSARDGVELAGWWIPGRSDKPSLLLCHDLGSSKEALLNLALHLQKAGFSVLAFDFRGHGASGGEVSTLGLEEKRDVIGAADYLASRAGTGGRSIGVYGAGMGAGAAVLAAADRPSLKVLVLDGLYPDVRYELQRRVYQGWGFGSRRLGFLPEAVFGLLHAPIRGEPSAAEVLPSLVGRHLLLVAPAGDTQLSSEIQRMYESIPDQTDADGNLVTLPGSGGVGLYGADLVQYEGKVSAFFIDRL